MSKLLLSLLLSLFLMDIAVASSCNRECKAHSNIENRFVVTDRCSITCPADYVPSCYCWNNVANCSCSKPRPSVEERLAEKKKASPGYCVKIYHYKEQKLRWWFDIPGYWDVCVTTQNGFYGDCDLLKRTIYIENAHDFEQYPMVRNCFGRDRIFAMKHDQTLVECCPFK